jgi:hypothetical protein
MTQNTSHAVMAQRAEPHDSLDDFPTPPWATRALLEHVIHRFNFITGRDIAWEPACNRGHMAQPLAEYFGAVITSDVADYGLAGTIQHDFLLPFVPFKVSVDWTISNPPFRLAEQFITRMAEVSRVGYAVLARTSFLEGVGRHDNLFSKNPPSVVAQFSERVPMVKGRYDPDASTATSYCWLVWFTDGPNRAPTRMLWIPPCRRQLERESDWPIKNEAA